MGIRTVGGCCCFDLKTGVLIIGILGIVGNVGNLIMTPISYNNACSHRNTPESREICHTFASRAGISIGSSVIALILLALMIYGSQKEKHGYMLPIIILEGISLILSAIFIWYMIIVSFGVSSSMGVTFLIVGNLIIVLGAYFWLVVYSRREEIKDGGISTGGYA